MKPDNLVNKRILVQIAMLLLITSTKILKLTILILVRKVTVMRQLIALHLKLKR